MCECNFTKIIWYKIFCIEQIQYQFSIVRSVGNSYPTCVSVFFDNDYLTVMSVFYVLGLCLSHCCISIVRSGVYVYPTVVSVLFVPRTMLPYCWNRIVRSGDYVYLTVVSVLYVLRTIFPQMLYQYCTFEEQWLPYCFISIDISTFYGLCLRYCCFSIVCSRNYCTLLLH